MQLASQGHHPRLDPTGYRGSAVVHWTLTVEGRATGWLTRRFHEAWRYVLLHTGARYHLLCPAYVLMPDHAHLIWVGVDEHGSDQRLAMEFLRRMLAPQLAPARWQHQAHDHVLRENERTESAFVRVATYILDNPVRAGLVDHRADYSFRGCCVPGYPYLEVADGDDWERFWRIHQKSVERA